jgi:hypothetical protein
MDDIANTALVHREECVPMDRPSSTRCEADNYVWDLVDGLWEVGGTRPCPNRADYKFGIGGGWSHICYHHYQGLPDAGEGCGCLVCTTNQA